MWACGVVVILRLSKVPSTGPGFEKVPSIGLGIGAVLTWTVRVEAVGSDRADGPVLSATENGVGDE